MKKFAFLIFIVFIISCNNKGKKVIETAKVQSGTFILDVTVEGEVDATNSINISSPALVWRGGGNLKINMIVEDGSKLERGDTAIMFDQSEVLKAKLDKEAELEIAIAELEKLKASHESKISELESNLKITEISYKISEINFEQSAYEADITRKEIKLNLEKAKITLEKARKEIENQKKIHNEEIQQALLNIKQIKIELLEAQYTMDKMIVTTPEPGIAMIRKNWDTDSKWQVGDQTWSGNALIDLPDLNELMIKANINEVDISKIKVGQNVDIKLDAFSDTSFEGTIRHVANLAIYKNRNSKIKVFPVEILIKGTSEKLMPGMTVSCKINIDKIESQVFIPQEALFKNGVEEYVYIRSGNHFKKKVIETGLSNNDYIIVKKGLKKDDFVAISDPFIENEKEI